MKENFQLGYYSLAQGHKVGTYQSSYEIQKTTELPDRQVPIIIISIIFLVIFFILQLAFYIKTFHVHLSF